MRANKQRRREDEEQSFAHSAALITLVLLDVMRSVLLIYFSPVG